MTNVQQDIQTAVKRDLKTENNKALVGRRTSGQMRLWSPCQDLLSMKTEILCKPLLNFVSGTGSALFPPIWKVTIKQGLVCPIRTVAQHSVQSTIILFQPIFLQLWWAYRPIRCSTLRGRGTTPWVCPQPPPWHWNRPESHFWCPPWSLHKPLYHHPPGYSVG